MNVIFVTLLATSLMQIGYFLWKVSADNQPIIGEVSLKTTIMAQLSDWRWVGGFVALVAGWTFFIQATSLGEISLIQPLMSSGDVLLILMAVVFLKERLKKVEGFGVGAIILGAFGLALQGTDRRIVFFNTNYLFILIVVVVLLGIFFYWLSRKSQKTKVHPEYTIN